MSAKSIEPSEKLAEEVKEPEEDSFDFIDEEFLSTAFINKDEALQNLKLDKSYKDTQATFIIGPSGTGKSTLACLLEKFLLSAKRDKTRWHFFSDPKSGVIIGNTSNSCTQLPTRIVIDNGKSVYFDFPGFFDRDQAKEIACSFYLKTLIDRTKAFRIILTINYNMFQDKSQPLIDLLEHVQGLFPKIDLLLEALFVVVTKVPSDQQIETTTISEIAQEFLDQTKGLNPKTSSILQWLANPHQSDRIEIFRQPSKPGEIDKSIFENIKSKLEKMPFIEKGAIEIYVPKKTEYYILKLVERLQKKMDDEVTKMIQKIEEICQRKIHSCTFKEVKDLILQVKDDIVESDQSYKDYQTDKDIANLLSKLCRYAKKINTDCLDGIEQLTLETFSKTGNSMITLKEIRPTTEFNVTIWQHKFRALKDRMMKITHFEYSEKTKGELEIKGIVIEAKNLESLFRAGLKSIKIYCAKAIFLDKVNIHCKGTSIAIIAPIWRVNGTNIIDISGEDGLPFSQRGNYHFDGKPGNPGGSAGNFLGICDQYVWNGTGELRIFANGGKGGPGEDGLNESENLKNMMQERDQNKPKIEIKKPERPVSHEPKLLTRGGKGGRGGCGGLGGNPGDVNITNEMNHALGIIIEKSTGEIGDNGNPGNKIDRSREKPVQKSPAKDQQKKVPALQRFCSCSCSWSDESGARSHSVRPDKKESHKIGTVTESIQISFQLSLYNTDEINTENMIQPSPNNVNLNAISVRETHGSYFNQIIREEGLQAIIGQNPFSVHI